MTNDRIIFNITTSDALRWTYRQEAESSVFPPAVCLLDGTYYKLSGFDKQSDDFFVIDATDFADALNISTGIYGAASLNTVELANLGVLCGRHGINSASVDVFAAKGIKGRQSMDTLSAVSSFDETVKKYISQKDIPLKTLKVYSKLSDVCKKHVINILTEKDLSTGDFRKLVNLLFDMGAKAENTAEGDLVAFLTEEKDKTRIEFMKLFGSLASGMPITVQSQDSFETGTLMFGFTASSAEEYTDKVKAASDSADKVKDIFRFLDEHNIS